MLNSLSGNCFKNLYVKVICGRKIKSHITQLLLKASRGQVEDLEEFDKLSSKQLRQDTDQIR